MHLVIIKVFPPTDAQENALKRALKFILNIDNVYFVFKILFLRYLTQNFFIADLIIYVVTPPN
jgi:hypothetical protein